MYLVFEVGGTKTRIGTSYDGKTIDNHQILSTPADFNEFPSLLKNSLGPQDKLNAIAGGIAGVLDQDKSTLLFGPHLSGWVGKPIKKTLAENFGVPVFLENDAALGGLGEATRGACNNQKIVAYLTIGTGIGGARILDGKIDHKAFGFEPGHQIIGPDNLQWEEYVSGPALEKEFGKPTEQITDSQIWDEAAKRVALGLSNTIMHWSPDIVILGGGLMQKIPLERIRFHLPSYLKVSPVLPTLTLSKLGELAGLYGALEYLKQNLTPNTLSPEVSS